jgi:hypothetical protein
MGVSFNVDGESEVTTPTNKPVAVDKEVKHQLMKKNKACESCF